MFAQMDQTKNDSRNLNATLDHYPNSASIRNPVLQEIIQP